jgi:hypothetical protein
MDHSMNDVSAREEEFHARYERFKARMRELRGLRVNQFLGLLETNQQRKVMLIEKEVEEFVRKFAYGGGLSPLLQENILVTFNSDQVLRKRIELQESRNGSGSAAGASRSRGDGGAPAPQPENGNGKAGFFDPTPAEISRQASRLMGGKRVSDQSLAVLQKAIVRKLGGNGNGNGRRVKLELTRAGKVSILVDDSD